MVYMRTQLKEIELFGSTLIRPMFTEFESWNDPSDLSAVMFGSSIMMSFTLASNQTSRNVTFPKEADWVNLRDFLETYKGGQTYAFNTSLTAGTLLFQKAGTIVPISDPTVENQTTDVKNTPLILSIALEDNQAKGFLYLEEGIESDFKTEFYEIRAFDNVIQFKQQDILGFNPTSNDTHIDQIVLTFAKEPVNQACALMNDLHTVRAIKTSAYDAQNMQVSLLIRNQSDPMSSRLKIDDIAYIFYGQSQ